MRASAEKAASDRRARAAAAAEAEEEETRAFDEPLALARTAGGDSAAVADARDRASLFAELGDALPSGRLGARARESASSPPRARGSSATSAPLALRAPSPAPLLPPPSPSETDCLKRDVASYAVESLRAHSRLMDACAETLGRASNPAELESASTRTTATLTSLRIASESAPLIAAAAVRDAAAATLRLAHRLAEMDHAGTEAAAEELRGYAGAAFASRPEALADVRSCLAASFLARPFSSLPPLAPDAVAAGGSAAVGNADASASAPLLDASGTLRAAAVARWAREYPAWLAHATVALGILDDAIDAGDPRERENATLDAPESDAEADATAFPTATDPSASTATSKTSGCADSGVPAPRDAAERVRAALPPSSATLDRLLAALVVTLVYVRRAEATSSSPIASRAAREGTRGPGVRGRLSSAARLARHAAAVAAVAPLAARHVDALVALAQLAHAPASADAARHQAATAVRALAWGALGEPTPMGPRLDRAAMPRGLRERFVRRVVVSSVAPNPQLLALAGGWLVRAMRDDVNGEGDGDGVDVARGVWLAATELTRDAGWTKPGEGGRHAFQGWYAEAGAGVAAGASAARERVELCLLAFHGLPRDARAAAAAETMAAFAGEGVGERRPRAGAVAKAARAHAALIAAHCARHFARCPTWLKTRAKRIVRGEVLSHGASAATDGDDFELTEFGSLRGRRGGAVRRPATPPALAALLFHLEERDASEEGEDDGVEDSTVPSSPARAAAVSVRAAAVALADASVTAASSGSSPALSPTAMSRSNSALSLELSGEASGAGAGAGSGAFATPRTSHAVDAYARRAAWSLLSALPRVTPTETFATAYGVVGGAGTLAFVWRAVESSRVGASRPVVDAVVAALRDETTAAEAFAGEDAACRAAMTCAAADALSRATAASASSESSSSSRKSAEASGEPAWATLVTLAEALAAATRRWTERALAARLSPGEARAASLMLGAGVPHAKYAPALRKIRSGLATDVADVVHGDGSWAFRREEALGKSVDAASITAAVPAYLRVAGDGDAAGALFACQLALDRALVAARDAARADASVSECAAAAAAATARLDVIAAHPSTEFAWSAASKAASKLDVDAGVSSARKPIDVGPAAAMATLRDGDASEAVDAVLESAASFASEARDRDAAALLDAAAALLSRGEPNLSSSAKISLVETLRRLARTDPAPARAAEDIARWNARNGMDHEMKRTLPNDADADADDGKPLAGGVERASASDSASSADWTLRVLVSDDATAESSATALMDFLLDPSDDVSDAAAGLLRELTEAREGVSSVASRAPVTLLAAMLRRIPEGCCAREPSESSRCARTLLRLALTHGETGARAAAETFAELVDTAAALAASEPAALASLRAQLRTLAAILAPEAISRRRPATVPSLPSVPVGVDVRSASTPPRSPTRASETGASTSSWLSASADRRLNAFRNATSRGEAALGDVAADPLGNAALQAAEAGLGLLQSNLSPGARARLLSSSLFGDLDLALGIGADDAPRGGDAERDATASARASLGIGFGLDDEGSDFEDDVDFGTVSAAAAAAAESTGSAGLGIAGRRAGRSMTTGGSIGRLDADVCTFVSSGSSFMEQHWYFCYTCDLTVSKGCCSACARTCHRGHKVVYSRESRFFCDCGAGSIHGAECRCLTSRSAAAAAAAADDDNDAIAAGIESAAAVSAASRGGGRPPGAVPVTEESDSELELDDGEDDDDEYFAVVGAEDDEDGRPVPPSELGAPEAVAALKTEILARALAAPLTALCERLVDRLRASAGASAAERGGDSTSISLLALPPPFALPPPPPPPRLAFPAAGELTAAPRSDLVHLRRSFKAGSFEVRPRAEHAAPAELQPAIAMGTLRRSALSCSRGAGLLAVAEGDKVCVLDAGALAGLGGPGTVGGAPARTAAANEKVGVRPLSRSAVKFEVARVLFNPADDSRLTVAGFSRCQIFTLGGKGEVTDRLCVGPEEWPVDGISGAILDVAWVPGSAAMFAVVVAAHVAIFDLSVSAVAPATTVSLPPHPDRPSETRASIVAAAFARREGTIALLLLSEDGLGYCHVFPESSVVREADVVVSPDSTMTFPDAVAGRAGLSLSYSPAHHVAFASFDGGATVASRLNLAAANPETRVVSSCVVREGADPLTTTRGPTGFSRWTDACAPPPPPLAGAPPGPVQPPPPIFVAVSARCDGGTVAVSLAEDEPAAQPLRAFIHGSDGVSSSAASIASSDPGPRVVGVAGFHPTDLDAAFLLTLRDDGSLQVYAQEPPPPTGVSAADVQQKQLARAAERASRRAAAAARLLRVPVEPPSASASASVAAPKFPLDFFERTTCVTSEVRFGGDLARRHSTESIRFALQSEDAHVEAPSPGACKITVAHSKPDEVIVGVRVHLGEGSSTQIPTEMRIGSPPPPYVPQTRPEAVPSGGNDAGSGADASTPADPRRVFRFEVGARRWYDAPLTPAESVAAERELELHVGPASNPALPVRVDHIEVYAMSKADFGWDAVVAAAAAEEGGDERDAGAAARTERVVRHLERYAATHVADPASEERILCTCLALLARAAKKDDEVREAAAAAALRILADGFDAESAETKTSSGVGGADASVSDASDASDASAFARWIPSVATRRLAWRALRAASPEDCARRKDEAATTRAASTAASLGSIDPRVGPGPADAAAFHAAARALARVAARRPGFIATSPSARTTTAALAHAAEDMLEAGAGAWDADEFAPHLAFLVAAVAEAEDASSEDGDVSTAFATDAYRLASGMLLAGREDARHAASDALADALIGPAASRSTSDYARCLGSAFGDEKDDASNAAAGARNAAAIAPAARTARSSPPGTEFTQFSCDLCDASPIVGRRWHCVRCVDFDLCDACHLGASAGAFGPASSHSASHPMIPYECGPGASARSPTRRIGIAGGLAATVAADARANANVSTTTTATVDSRLSSPPSPGRLFLASALASADDDALGPARGVETLAPYFVLLRRLVSVPSYAAAMAPAVVSAAEHAASTFASRREGVSASERLLLRLSLLSALLATRAEASEGDDAFDVPAPGDAFASHLLAVVDRAHASSTSSPLPEPRAKVAQKTSGVARWGDSTAAGVDATAAAEFALVAIANAADEPGVPGYGALLAPGPPFGPPRATASTDVESHLLETAVAVMHQLVTPAEKEKEKAKDTERDARRSPSLSSSSSSSSLIVPGGASSILSRRGGFRRSTRSQQDGQHVGVGVASASLAPLAALDATRRDAWTRTLADVLADPRRAKSSAPRRAARKLLLVVAGSRDAYHAARDAAALADACDRLESAALASPGPWLMDESPYAASLAAASALAAAAEVAATRAKSWRAFVATRPEILARIARLAPWVPEATQLDALKLLARAAPGGGDAEMSVTGAGKIRVSRVARLEENEAGKCPGVDDACPSLERIVDEFDRFARCFILGSPSAAVRAAAAATARAAWRSASAGSNARRRVATALFDELLSAAARGERAAEAFELARWMLRSSGDGVDDAVAEMVATTRAGAAAEALTRTIRAAATHPNAKTYAAARASTDDDGFYLETAPGPCAADHADAETGAGTKSRAGRNVGVGADAGEDSDDEGYRRAKLDSTRGEIRYTDRAFAARLTTRSTVKSVIVAAHTPSRSMKVRRAVIYRCADAGVDVGRLRGDRSLWLRVATVEFPPGATEATAELPAPLVFAGVVVEFTAFHVSLHAKSQESLKCPRCSRHVTDRHGVCGHCRENAYQCRHCRNINYEHPDAFFCNECGHSRHARVEVTLVSRPAGGYPRVRTEEEAARAVEDLETESAAAARARDAVLAAGTRLRTLLEGRDDDDDGSRLGFAASAGVHGRAQTHDGPRRVAEIARFYGERCKAAREEVVAAERRRRDIQRALSAFAASRVDSRVDDEDARAAKSPTFFPLAPSPPPTEHFGCLSAFVARAIPACAALVAADERRQKRVQSETGSTPVSVVAAAMTSFGVPDALLAVPSFADATTRRDARALLVAIVHASPPRVVDAVSATLHTRVCEATRRSVGDSGGFLGGFGFGFGTLVDDCATLADLASAARLDVDDVDVDDVDGVSPFFSDDALDVDALLRDDLARLAGIDVDVGRAASDVDADATATGSNPTRLESSRENRTPKSGSERIGDVPPATRRLLHLARDVAASGGAKDPTLCECLILPALRLLRGPCAGPSICRGPAARALLASAKPLPRRSSTSSSLSTSTDVAVGAIDSMPAPATTAAAIRLGRRWREVAARRRRRAGLVGVGGFGSAVSVAERTVDDETRTEMVVDAEWREGYDADDLSAVRGAGAWALELLLASDSADVRAESVATLRRLSVDGERQRFAILARLCSAISEASRAPAAVADDFFDALSRVAGDDPVAWRFLARRGALGRCAEELTREAARLLAMDADGCVDPNAGAAFGRLAETIARLCEGAVTKSSRDADASAAAALAREPGAFRAVFRASLAAKSLVGARTIATSAAEAELSALVDRVAAADDGGVARAELVDAAVDEIRRATGCRVFAGEEEGAEERGIEGVGSRSRASFLASAFPSAPPGHALASLTRLLLPDVSSGETSYPLRLIKSSTQEEFIRGQMTMNPYGSAEIGAKTFRDVKNFICASLDMHGLCDDDYGMELLVAGRIVSLDLDVADVYERVWRIAEDARRRERDDAAARDDDGDALGARSSLRRRLDDDNDDDAYDVPGGVGIGGANDSPMTVTYRLQGLDGEATEEMISSVEKAEVDEADPEETYADTALLRRRDGLSALLALVPLLSGKRDAAGSVAASTRTSAEILSSTPDTHSLAQLTVGTAETCASLMRLLTAAAEVSLNRRALLDAGALPALLAEASRIFSVEDDAARERANELLLLVERLLREEAAAKEEKARARSPGGLSRSLSRSFAEAAAKTTAEEDDETESDESENVSEASESADDVRVFLGKLAELTSSGQRAAADTLARVLPRLAAADAAATETLARHVAVSVARLRRLDEMPAGPAANALALELRCSSLVAEGIADDASGARLRSRLLARGALRAVAGYLLDDAFAAPAARARDKSSREWTEACARPALPLALAALRGFSRCHPETARAASKARAATKAHATTREGRSDTPGARDVPEAERFREVEPLTLLELLHALESTAEHGVGTAAENALEALEEAYDDARVAVEALRRATRAESMRKAMERRERMLREMGLTRLSPAGGDDSASAVSGATTPRASSTPPNSTPTGSLGSWPPSPSPGRASDILAVAVSPGSMLGFEDLSDEEDEDGALVCRVCREGYKSRPRELLGVYCFCKRVEGAAAAGGGGGTPSSTFAGASSAGYSSVSHFNAIHFSCHAAARARTSRSDRRNASGKAPRFGTARRAPITSSPWLA